MQLESDQYFQAKRNVEAYIDEFKDLIDLSGYTDPIAIVLKFRRGLNPTTQDRIAESGMDRPSDMDFDGWFKAAQCLDLNRLANEFSFIRSHPPTAATPAAMHAPSRALPPGTLWMSTALGPSNPSHKPATAVARPVTSAKSVTFIMTSVI
jgi:hypothetical protein